MDKISKPSHPQDLELENLNQRSNNMNQLEQLASLTTIVADTGDIASIAKIQPQDATTNPSLILKASKDPAYRAFLTEAVENSVSLEDAADRVLVNFGAEIIKHVKGRVSTEVDARLSSTENGF